MTKKQNRTVEVHHAVMDDDGVWRDRTAAFKASLGMPVPLNDASESLIAAAFEEADRG